MTFWNRKLLLGAAIVGLLFPAALMAQVGGDGSGDFGGSFFFNPVDSLQAQMNADNVEWNILAPKLQRVIDTGGIVQTAQSGDMQAQNPVAVALTDLQSALDKSATPVQINGKLTTYRAALKKARAENAAAQEDLRRLLTVRQEAVLLTLGYLE